MSASKDGVDIVDAGFEERRLTRRALAKLRLGHNEAKKESKVDINGFDEDHNEDLANLDAHENAADFEKEATSTSSPFLLSSSMAAMASEGRQELEKRLETFEHITQNVYLCERKINRQSVAMECDCVVPPRSGQGCLEQCLNRLLMIECSKECSLGALCGNRKFQRCENARVEVFKTLDKGFGLRALQDLPPDEFIMEYVGEVLDGKQFGRRARRYAKEDVKHFYFMALSADLCIDASNKGNISRFINHSCDPNAETQKWTVEGELRVGFFTKMKIRRGEEITFDYKYERYGQQAQKCFCGSQNCRGWLGGEPDEDEDEDDDDDNRDDDDGDDSSTSSSSSDDNAASNYRMIHKRPTTKASRRNKIVVRQGQRKRLRKRAPRKIKNYEAEEIGEEIESLLSTGIRTKQHTVSLCRLMVRAVDLPTRTKLAQLLINADTPCRRLFLDYRGLKIIHAWMPGNETAMAVSDVSIKLLIENCLESLTIPHRTMLVESKVLHRIQQWADIEVPSESSSEEDSDDHTKCPKRDDVKDENDGEGRSNEVENLAKSLPQASSVTSNVTASVTTNTEPAASPDSTENDSDKNDMNTDSLPQSVQNGISSNNEMTTTSSTTTKHGICGGLNEGNEAEAALNNDEEKERRLNNSIMTKTEDSLVTKFENAKDIVIKKEIVDAKTSPSISWQPKESNEMEHIKQETEGDFERYYSSDLLGVSSSEDNVHKKTPVEVAHDDKQTPSSSSMFKLEIAVREKLDEMIEKVSKSEAKRLARIKAESRRRQKEQLVLVRDRASKLISLWSSLKEEFKIPKLDQIKLRAEHEQEADREAAIKMRQTLSPTPTTSSSVPHCLSITATSPMPTTPAYLPRTPMSMTTSASRTSRFNDQSGLLHKRDLSRDHRRQLFQLRTEVEEREKRQRSLWQQQHEHKCRYLRLDPRITAMFSQHPDYYLDVGSNQWVPMPPPEPQVDVTWGYPKMASLPLSAFRPETDPPLPDPAYVYPPGVVPVSYLYNVMQEEEYVEQVGEVGEESEVKAENGANDESYFEDNDQGLPDDSQKRVELEAQSKDEVMNASDSSTLSTIIAEPTIKGKRRCVELCLPPNWRMSQDEKGRTYYYNGKTKVTQWEPPMRAASDNEDNSRKLIRNWKVQEIDMETASVASEGDDEKNAEVVGDDDESGNAGDQDDEGRREVSKECTNADMAEIEILSSDLSASEKALLLAKDKSREERQHERRQKRERDREKNEYERKKRRERHTKHRRDGLVTEHLIPKRSKNERGDLMTLEEMRQRLANRDLIREQQELEEQMEEEREQQEQQLMLLNAEMSKRESRKENFPSTTTTMAAADTSSEVAKKIKENFMKESSKVIVKALAPYMHEDCARGRVVSKEDFKHLAKKLTTCIMNKELRRCERIEQLNCTDSVKKKTAEFVVKYMSQFGAIYKRKRERGAESESQ